MKSKWNVRTIDGKLRGRFDNYQDAENLYRKYKRKPFDKYQKVFLMNDDQEKSHSDLLKKWNI